MFWELPSRPEKTEKTQAVKYERRLGNEAGKGLAPPLHPRRQCRHKPSRRMLPERACVILCFEDSCGYLP